MQPVLVLPYPNSVQVLGMEQPTGRGHFSSYRSRRVLNIFISESRMSSRSFQYPSSLYSGLEVQDPLQQLSSQLRSVLDL